MDLKDKIIDTLRKSFSVEYVRLEDDEGISGFVVSSQFENMSTQDRQQSIIHALRNAADPLSAAEQRQVLMIAGLTPLEYESVGAQIRVHQVRELPDGFIEISLHGGYSDAMYVRGTLLNQKGVSASEPIQSPTSLGVLMTFTANGTDASPLSKEKAISILEADQYIGIMERATAS